MNEGVRNIQLSFEDLAFVIRDSALVIDDFSPLAQDAVMQLIDPYGKSADQRAGQSSGPDQQEIASLVRKITHPQMKMICRFGGGKMPAAEQTLCFDAANGENPVGISFLNDRVKLFAYDGLKSILDGFIAKYASKNEGVTPNLIPPMISLESFVAVLHSIDMYRRSLYASLLRYEPQSEPGFTLDAYSAELVKALKSRDIRWLTPCFVNIVPNLPADQFKFDPDSLKFLVDSGLCKMMKHKETNQLGMAFTEEGKALGVEFERTWQTSTGFELSLKTSTGSKVLEKGFLAPTAAANHLVLLKESEAGIQVNHQAFQSDQLRAWLNGLFAAPSPAPIPAPSPASIPAPSPAPIADPGPVPSPAPASEPKLRICVNCGNKLDATVKFCTRCGAKN